jgi:hypothetical protein
MDIGMLWYDDDHKRPIGEKVARAVEHYKTKYGVTPTVCFANPATLQGAPDVAAGVHLRSARTVLVNHFWIGVGDAGANGSTRTTAGVGGKHGRANGSNGHAANGSGARRPRSRTRA